MENLNLLIQSVLGKQDIEDELQLCAKLLNSSLKCNTSLSQVDHLIRKKLLSTSPNNTALEYVTLMSRLNQNNIPQLSKLLNFLYLVSNQQQSEPKIIIPSMVFMDKGFSTPSIPQEQPIEMDQDPIPPKRNEQEIAFCQDLFFIFQGINGKSVAFINGIPTTSLQFTEIQSSFLVELFQLGEMAFKMKLFISTPTNSFLIRSVQAGVEQELRQMQQLSIAAQYKALTLGHVYAQVFPYFFRYSFILGIFNDLNTSTVNSESITTVVSYLNKGFSSGDDLKMTLSEQFLNLISIPYIDQIFNWMIYGELNDPFNEFFIVKNDNPSFDFPNPQFWQNAFYTRSSSIPFLNDPLQRDLIFNVGKSSRLLGLGDDINANWLIQNSKLFFKSDLDLRDKSATNRFLIKVKSHVDHQLMQSLFLNKYQLLQSMQFLKDLFFTQRGDLLLETYHQLQQFLEMPATSSVIYEASAITNTLTNGLTKLGTSCKLVIMNTSSNTTPLLWSCLSFTPTFRFPLNNFFDHKIIKRYQGMFGFFNSLKYIYYRLTKLWKCIRTMLISVRRHTPQFYAFIKKCSVYNQHYISIVNAVLYYSLYEVVEQNSHELDVFIKQGGYGLQELINEHVNTIKTLRGAITLDDTGSQFSNLWQLLQELHHYVIQQVLIN